MFTRPRHKILGNLAHIFRTFLRFPTTTVQSSFDSFRTLPRHFNNNSYYMLSFDLLN